VHRQRRGNPESEAWRLYDSCGSRWATVCKTVRPMLSDRCPVCLSVTLVYCGQTVGWIKMKLGMQGRLGPGHIVFDADPSPPRERGTAAPPSFRPLSIVATVAYLSYC